MSDEGWQNISDQLYHLGPVGFWRWAYRVSIRDVSPYDGPSEFTVSLEQKKGEHWHSVSDERVTLYAEGKEREGTLNDRTKPSEGERERLDELSRLFPF